MISRCKMRVKTTCGLFNPGSSVALLTFGRGDPGHTEHRRSPSALELLEKIVDGPCRGDPQDPLYRTAWNEEEECEK